MRNEKSEVINEMCKYPEYAVPSRKYLRTKTISELKEALSALQSIFDGVKYGGHTAEQRDKIKDFTIQEIKKIQANREQINL